SLQKYDVLPRTAAPVRDLPREAAMIDDFARPGDVARLEGRPRVWHFEMAINPVGVERARADAGTMQRVPAVGAALHRMQRAAEQKIDLLCSRRPETKGRAGAIKLRTETLLHYAAPAKTWTERGGACWLAPDA